MRNPDAEIIERARKWTGESFDASTREEVQKLIKGPPEALAEAFYRNLEFGTGGLRGLMGPGTNRVNKYTIGMATQGLANYVLKSFPDDRPPSVVVAHDCRHNSDFFASVTAEVFSANGIKVYVFDALRPTPLLSFAVRELGCRAGVMITASHNPKEYNGYKVYWDDGGQLVPPHDHNVIAQVKQVDPGSGIRFGRAEELIEILDDSFDKKYIEAIKTLSLSPKSIKKYHNLPIVFTPIHGTTVRLLPQALKAFGFSCIYNVPEQDSPDGSFPTVASPNPEEGAAFDMALEIAARHGAELVMATDPDGDRLGAAVKDPKGTYVLLNGNQLATILSFYVLEQWKQQGKLRGDEYIVKTIVTTELLNELASAYGVECLDVLTGFKYIAEKMRLLEVSKRFLCGGEESYGFTIGDYVRDKDAVISCCMLAEAAAWAKGQGKSLYELLIGIYANYRLYVETLLSVTKKGREGAREIRELIEGFREDPPKEIDGLTIARIRDYQSGAEKDLYMGEIHPIDLPRANVLQFLLEDGSLITMRPSGTEPKIKFYFGCSENLSDPSHYEEKRISLLHRLQRMQKELGLK